MSEYPYYKSNALFVFVFFVWRFMKYLVTGKMFSIIITYEGGINLKCTPLLISNGEQNG